MNDAGPLEVELWDDDGPLTTRATIELARVMTDDVGVYFLPAQGRCSMAVRDGIATKSVFYAVGRARWFCERPLAQPLVIEAGHQCAVTPDVAAFAMKYEDMHEAIPAIEIGGMT